ncbi:MAG: hypothetical protein QNJ18_19880 [Xenococcaceae cyanobacterium MO_167.B52]|nr:hypothetical protein [Xenococcaceae cyanobacterium MO_167.B52]
MPQSQIKTKTPAILTCANCPKFDNYNEPNSQAWCNAFNIAARNNHTMTADWLSCLRSESEPEFISGEDNLFFLKTNYIFLKSKVE